jgi:hypothetical protein
MESMPAGFDLERLYGEHAQALFAFLLNFTRDEQNTNEVPRHCRSYQTDITKRIVDI